MPKEKNIFYASAGIALAALLVTGLVEYKILDEYLFDIYYLTERSSAVKLVLYVFVVGVVVFLIFSKVALNAYRNWSKEIPAAGAGDQDRHINLITALLVIAFAAYALSAYGVVASARMLSVSDSGNYYIYLSGYERGEVWDYKEVLRNREKLLDKYPNAQIYKQVNSSSAGSEQKLLNWLAASFAIASLLFLIIAGRAAYIYNNRQ